MASILVADDEAEVRELLEEVLTRQGHSVSLAGDGAQALDIVRREGNDVVVCDIWMPDVDGLSFLKQIKSEQPAARVVVISGGGPGQSLELSTTLAQTYGAEDVLIKPFRNERIVQAINTCLGQ